MENYTVGIHDKTMIFTGKKRSFKWDNVRICLVTLGCVWEKKGNAWEHIDIYGKIV